MAHDPAGAACAFLLSITHSPPRYHRNWGYRTGTVSVYQIVSLGEQVVFLVVLAIPIACVAWTVTHEEVLREPREWCKEQSERCHSLVPRKFFYLFTCEYCFSHYVTVAFLFITKYKLLYSDWRGYLIAFFALVWVANVYMNFYSRIRLDLKRERVEIAAQEKTVQESEPELVVPRGTL